MAARRAALGGGGLSSKSMKRSHSCWFRVIWRDSASTVSAALRAAFNRKSVMEMLETAAAAISIRFRSGGVRILMRSSLAAVLGMVRSSLGYVDSLGGMMWFVRPMAIQLLLLVYLNLIVEQVCAQNQEEDV